MNKNFLIYCACLLLGGVAMAASIALFTFLLFALGDSIFITGRTIVEFP
jgi:hypothetical protein